jgi:3'(2'), 5'-bisphosphate nucleotidase
MTAEDEPALGDLDALLAHSRAAARRAGGLILGFFGTADRHTKADGSPVTEADRVAEAEILAALNEARPDIPVVAEESVDAGRIPTVGDGPFWLVDPLDGTKAFLRANGEFTVNIALVQDRQPLLGVVLAPALELEYAGIVGRGAVRSVETAKDEPIAVRKADPNGLIVVTSRSHRDNADMQAYLADLSVAETRPISSSLKLCLIAEGSADLYPRFGPTSEWDIAAGHAVLAAAGGRVDTIDSGPLSYAKPDFLNPSFVARGG